MIAKALRCRRGSSSPSKADPFCHRINYLCRKAADIVMVNLAGVWTDAARQMAATGTLAPRCHQPAYHLVLSWAPADAPSAPEMIAAARDLLHRIGASAHQAVIARHNDRPHPHLHILLNRVHPLTGKRLAQRHDYALLELACRRIEADFGWTPDRGRFDVRGTEASRALTPKPTAHWQQKAELRAQGIRPDGPSVRGPEQRQGWPALRDAIAPKTLRKIVKTVATAPNWQTLHDGLRAHSLRYLRLISGGRIAHDRLDWAMPAGHLGTSCTLPNLERRLGPYQPDARSGPDPDATLTLAPFMEDLTPALTQIAQAVTRRAADRNARAILKRMLKDETALLRNSLGDSRSPFATALRKVRADLHRRVLRDWDKAHPRPRLGMEVIEAASPALALRRRYRALFRGKAIWDDEGTPPDPTAIRQAKALAQNPLEEGARPDSP